jgi:hypothetical protein
MNALTQAAAGVREPAPRPRAAIGGVLVVMLLAVFALSVLVELSNAADSAPLSVAPAESVQAATASMPGQWLVF